MTVPYEVFRWCGVLCFALWNLFFLRSEKSDMKEFLFQIFVRDLLQEFRQGFAPGIPLAMDLKRGKNFTTAEDEQICRSWLWVSKDSIKETDQQRNDFWTTVKNHVEKIMPSLSGRTADGLRQRFQHLSALVSKYSSCVSFVNKLNASGTSAEDRAQKARDMFLSDTKSKTFKIQSCYDILKDEPKYKMQEEVRHLKKRRHVNTSISKYISNEISNYVKG
ncbi:uncharacterized protein LOC110681396 [Aedes aegypti]|uniref:Myb-like domain-containing protein n=1 Tax=Aedes aegypti TaxID=7159 RepID=A0A903VSK4_AEDAE|nr:uncharacterized protein LOC110681396 [Aedes aegypti]